MTSNQIIEELRALRTRWYEAEFEFYKEARTIEDSRRDEWRQDFVTFDELLDRSDVCESSRYRSFIEACDVLGEDKVRYIGIAAAIVAARHHDGVERKKMIEHFELSRKENGKPLSERQVRSVQIRLSKEERQSGYAERATRREGREQELYAETVELRRRVKALEKENGELRERLALIDGGGVAKKGGARKPPRKPAS